MSFCLNLLFSLPYDKKLAFIFQTPRGLRSRGVTNAAVQICVGKGDVIFRVLHLAGVWLYDGLHHSLLKLQEL